MRQRKNNNNAEQIEQNLRLNLNNCMEYGREDKTKKKY